MTRVRWPIAATGALGVVGVVVAALVAPRGGDALAGAIIVVATCGALAVMLTPGLREQHPIAVRLAGTVASIGALLMATAFLSTTTDYNLAIAAAVAIVLVGLSLLTGVSGQISLGNGAFMGVGAYVMAVWANHHTTTPIVASLILALASGAVVGLLLGLPATRLRGPYLAGMTLAFAVAFGSILDLFPSWTGGDSGLQLPHTVVPPRWLSDLFAPGTSPLRTSSVWLADLALVVAGIAFFFIANLFASRVGRSMRLVRDHDVAAELVGVALPRTRILAFVVSAAYAALGGAMLTIVNNAVSPTTYSFALSITILAVVVIGGIGTVGAAVIGALIYAYSTTVINWFVNHTGLNPQGNLASQLNGIIFGGLLILTMLFAPRGLIGGARALVRRARRLP